MGYVRTRILLSRARMVRLLQEIKTAYHLQPPATEDMINNTANKFYYIDKPDTLEAHCYMSYIIYIM